MARRMTQFPLSPSWLEGLSDARWWSLKEEKNLIEHTSLRKSQTYNEWPIVLVCSFSLLFFVFFKKSETWRKEHAGWIKLYTGFRNPMKKSMIDEGSCKTGMEEWTGKAIREKNSPKMGPSQKEKLHLWYLQICLTSAVTYKTSLWNVSSGSIQLICLKLQRRIVASIHESPANRGFQHLMMFAGGQRKSKENHPVTFF